MIVRIECRDIRRRQGVTLDHCGMLSHRSTIGNGSVGRNRVRGNGDNGKDCRPEQGNMHSITPQKALKLAEAHYGFVTGHQSGMKKLLMRQAGLESVRKHLRELRGRHRLAEEETLDMIAAPLAQEVELLGGFNAFGHAHQ